MTRDATSNRHRLTPRIVALCIFAMLNALLAACDDPAPHRIGFIGGLSGRSADVGEASRNAVQLAVETVNRDGGINGHQIELLVRDDANDPNLAAKEVRNLHAAGVVAIIGPNLSSIGAGMLPVVDELKLVTVSPTMSSLIFSGKDDYMFRINSTTRENAEIYAEQYFSRGIKRVSAAVDKNNKVFSESWLNEFSQAFGKLGGDVIATDQFDANAARGYSETAIKLLEPNPEAILLVANSVDTAQMAQQIRKLNQDVLLVAAEWAASERLLFLGGHAIDGLELLQSYDRDDTSAHYLRFRNDYIKQFQQEPGYSSIAAYDAATVLFKGLAEQGSAPLKDTLLKLAPVKGLQQEIKFNAFGDLRRKAFFVVVRDGQFKSLK